MSSSDSEILISTSLPISELIKHIKHCFRERDFNKIQSILMDRENDMKMEIEDLIRYRNSAKEEVRLLERNGNLAEFERLKLEEKLQKGQRKCEDLEETVTRLLEEKRVSNDREKRAEERCDKVCAENSKMANEKNKSIFELSEKINQLKNKNLENERLVGVYQEKCKCLDLKIVKMGQEIEELKLKQLEGDRIVEEELNEKINELKNKNLENERLVGVYEEKCKCLDLKIVKMGQEIEESRLKQLEGDRVVEELKRGNLEANKTIDELRLKKSEYDKEAEMYKSRLESLSPRMMKIEEELAGMLTVKVEDLAGLVNDVRMLATSEEGGYLEFPYFKGEKDNLGNDSTPDDDAEDVVVLSPRGVPPTPTSTRSRSQELTKKGYINLIQSRTRKGDARTVKPSSGSQSGRNPPQPQSNECKEPLGSGAHASGAQLMSWAGRFSKITRSSSTASGDIIEIIDSDDETKSNGAADMSIRGVVGSNVGEYEISFVRSPSSSQRSKRKLRDSTGDLFANSTTKRKKNMCTGDEDNVLIHEKENEAGPASDSQIPLEKLNGLNDEVSGDSDDESLSDSKIHDYIAGLRSEMLGRKFTYEADMLRAFQQDEELCMNAVCALYRQQVVARKSKGRSNSSKNGGFSPVDSMSGCALAVYLIDGDKELRLRKSVSEVKKEHPDVIGQCRKLANIYAEKLFAIYCSAEDPFFGQ